MNDCSDDQIFFPDNRTILWGTVYNGHIRGEQEKKRKEEEKEEEKKNKDEEK